MNANEKETKATKTPRFSSSHQSIRFTLKSYTSQLHNIFELSHSPSLSLAACSFILFSLGISVYSLRNHDYRFFSHRHSNFQFDPILFFARNTLTITTIDSIFSSFRRNFVVPVRFSLSAQ